MNWRYVRMKIVLPNPPTFLSLPSDSQQNLWIESSGCISDLDNIYLKTLTSIEIVALLYNETNTVQQIKQTETRASRRLNIATKQLTWTKNVTVNIVMYNSNAVPEDHCVPTPFPFSCERIMLSHSHSTNGTGGNSPERLPLCCWPTVATKNDCTTNTVTAIRYRSMIAPCKRTYYTWRHR